MLYGYSISNVYPQRKWQRKIRRIIFLFFCCNFPSLLKEEILEVFLIIPKQQMPTQFFLVNKLSYFYSLKNRIWLKIPLCCFIFILNQTCTVTYERPCMVAHRYLH